MKPIEDIPLPPGKAITGNEFLLDLVRWRNLKEHGLDRDSYTSLEFALNDPNKSARLIKLGFREDFWLPVHIAAKWKTTFYPSQKTQESVDNWKRQVTELSSYFLKTGLTKEDITLQLAFQNDLALIREYAPNLLPKQSSSIPSAAKDAVHVNRHGQQSQQDDKPCWDAALRELKFRGVVIKKWNRPAHNQTAIIDEFQKQNWPAVIVAPSKLTGKALGDTIDDLKNQVKEHGLAFGRNGTGTGITWSIIDRPEKAAPKSKKHRRSKSQ
ncbi:MAG TPA: hypothetical protein PLN21_09955 [Gemmatales bacterium]|nr:hypothetical protein [Gemmatales bacterium]